MIENEELGVNGEVTRPIMADDHWFAVMGTTGDTKTIWDKNEPAEVEIARQAFESLKAKGYTAFRVTGKDGEKGEKMTEFDPDAERVILVAPLMGG